MRVGSGVCAVQSGRLYRDLLGEFNQQVARVADQASFWSPAFP